MNAFRKIQSRFLIMKQVWWVGHQNCSFKDEQTENNIIDKGKLLGAYVRKVVDSAVNQG